MKTVGGLRRTRYRGLHRTQLHAYLVTAVAINAKIAVSKAVAGSYGVGETCNQPGVLRVPPSQYGTVNWFDPAPFT